VRHARPWRHHALTALLYHTRRCVVDRPCSPVYVPQLLALLHWTITDQLKLSAVHGASHQRVGMMRPRALPYPCHWRCLTGYGSPDWLIQDHPRLSECSIVGRLACLLLTTLPRADLSCLCRSVYQCLDAPREDGRLLTLLLFLYRRW